MEKFELEYQPKKIRAYAVKVLMELTKKKTRPMLMCFRNWETRVGFGGSENEEGSDDQTRVLVFNDKYISFLIPWMMSFCWHVDEIMEELADLRDLNTVSNGKLTLGPVFSVAELVKIDMIFRLFTTIVPKQNMEPKRPVSKMAEVTLVEQSKSTMALKSLESLKRVEAPEREEISEPAETQEPVRRPEPAKADTNAVSKPSDSIPPASFRTLDPSKHSRTANPSVPSSSQKVSGTPCVDYEFSEAVAQKPVQSVGTAVVIQKPMFDDLVNKIQGLQLSIEIMQNT
ncbi:hypothetical protein KL933_004627 [Ogataea haglerorum]|uniref:Uncharacterized protein n=1 Tax=Ogataea haglerorum TaxID=1937702 RepID=A0AAN6D1X2_9ASCO|nr:hypothetical protein KL933_004627 [Ogataea haglerorum]KAG7727801.1 hypothetical protein KL948_004328 [Ogataea haglerorum]